MLHFANSWEAIRGQILMGSRYPPILRNNWAKMTPSRPTNARWSQAGSCAPGQIGSHARSHARVYREGASGCVRGKRETQGLPEKVQIQHRVA